MKQIFFFILVKTAMASTADLHIAVNVTRSPEDQPSQNYHMALGKAGLPCPNQAVLVGQDCRRKSEVAEKLEKEIVLFRDEDGTVIQTTLKTAYDFCKFSGVLSHRIEENGRFTFKYYKELNTESHGKEAAVDKQFIGHEKSYSWDDLSEMVGAPTHLKKTTTAVFDLIGLGSHKNASQLDLETLRRKIMKYFSLMILLASPICFAHHQGAYLHVSEQRTDKAFTDDDIANILNNIQEEVDTKDEKLKEKIKSCAGENKFHWQIYQSKDGKKVVVQYFNKQGDPKRFSLGSRVDGYDSQQIKRIYDHLDQNNPGFYEKIKADCVSENDLDKFRDATEKFAPVTYKKTAKTRKSLE